MVEDSAKRPTSALRIGVLEFFPASGDIKLLGYLLGNIRTPLPQDILISDKERRLLSTHETRLLAALMQAQGKAVSLPKLALLLSPEKKPDLRFVSSRIGRLRWIIGANHLVPHFVPHILQDRWYFEYQPGKGYALRVKDFIFSAQRQPKRRPESVNQPQTRYRSRHEPG